MGFNIGNYLLYRHVMYKRAGYYTSNVPRISRNPLPDARRWASRSCAIVVKIGVDRLTKAVETFGCSGDRNRTLPSRTGDRTMWLVRVLASAAIALGPVPLAAAATPDGSGSYHLFPMSGLIATQPSVEARSRNAARTELYYGGPVLPKIKVVTVIWGNDVNKITINNIGPFFAGIVNSTFVDQLTQYSTNLTGVNGHAGTHQTIGRGIYRGQFKITPGHKSANLTNAAVQSELKAQIAAKHLPAADQNTLYMVYFPSSITITAGNAVSCRQFAAYHSASPGTVGNNVFYGVMPDCLGGFVEQTVSSSHEFAEALTDGIPTPGSHPAYPQAWNTSDGEEIGDLCEGTRATLTVGANRYRIQQVFLNTTKACSKGSYQSP
jgi:hypothetical protein